jgi:hypothetical protein
MSPVRTLIAVALVSYLAAPAHAAALGGKKAGKKKDRPTYGQIISMETDAKTGTGTVTVRLHQKTKSATASPPVEKTFKTTSDTKYGLVVGRKGAVKQSTTTASTLKKGDNVLVFAKGTDATDVKVISKKAPKTKKKKTA